MRRVAATRRRRSQRTRPRTSAPPSTPPTSATPCPPRAVAASLGCGNPTAVADLTHGETVLDLGSGGGIDVLLSARRVGPTGKAYGLDMTDEMLALARAQRRARPARRTSSSSRAPSRPIPLPANTIDVVISNCVINLSTDKPAVFAETSRVLRPGGRIGVSDVVADDALTPAERAERGDYVGCIAGALSFTEYRDGLRPPASPTSRSPRPTGSPTACTPRSSAPPSHWPEERAPDPEGSGARRADQYSVAIP